MVMQMDEGLDTGPIVMAERVPIAPDATAGDLHDQLARRGADLMVRALDALERDELTRTPQPEAGVTYAHKLGKDETRIDWSRPWKEVHDHIRGLSPFPGAWFELAGERAPVRVKALRTTRGEGTGAPGTVLDHRLTVACGDGAVRLLELQRAGRQAMQADEFLRGTPVAVGTRFGSGAIWLVTSSPSNMMDARSSAGRSRTTERPCKACWPPPSRGSAARRSPSTAPDVPTPACMRSGRSAISTWSSAGTPTPCATP
jgi:hypothetical protein